MKPVCFSICRTIVAHPDRWAIIQLRIERGIHDHASFRYVQAKSDSCKCMNFPTSCSTNIDYMFFKC